MGLIVKMKWGLQGAGCQSSYNCMAWIAPTFDYGYDEVQRSAMMQTSNFDQFHRPSTDSMRGDLSVTEIVIHTGTSNIMCYQNPPFRWSYRKEGFSSFKIISILVTNQTFIFYFYFFNINIKDNFYITINYNAYTYNWYL